MRRGVTVINVTADRPPPALLTTAEAARRLGIHPKTLTNYVRDGKIRPTLRLPADSLGRSKYRWDYDDVRRQLDALADDDQ